MGRTSFDLVEPHIPSLRRYALVLLRHDETRADDLVQDCLVRALSRWHLWKRPGNLRAWLFTILHNIYVNDVARAAARPDVVEIQDYFPAMAVPANQTDRVRLREVVSAIQALPDNQRQTLLLVTMEGFSYEETADITGVPIGTVMSRLSRARDKVRDTSAGDRPARGRSVT
ncbi:MAG: sigma-70 family RNA polymerase sigma factor [Alphaproteobacteria bacterium]|nr:sigma-70 family RNA polymerase sigma factor [Alphaproteobacteria bacterium]